MCICCSNWRIEVQDTPQISRSKATAADSILLTSTLPPRGAAQGAAKTGTKWRRVSLGSQRPRVRNCLQTITNFATGRAYDRLQISRLSYCPVRSIIRWNKHRTKLSHRLSKSWRMRHWAQLEEEGLLSIKSKIADTHTSGTKEAFCVSYVQNHIFRSSENIWVHPDGLRSCLDLSVHWNSVQFEECDKNEHEMDFWNALNLEGTKLMIILL